ncbi:hypothetical protein BJY00DRAFT_291066 [Aspergillus carlsbadensis]|nr:hypothetical protein BJY00DRAFT_291066 [Aspergillus carlsbadensis]
MRGTVVIVPPITVVEPPMVGVYVMRKGVCTTELVCRVLPESQHLKPHEDRICGDVSRRERQGEIIKDAGRVCRLICKHLQDCASLESLVLEMWYYQASRILMIDPDHQRARRLSNRRCTTNTSLPVAYVIFGTPIEI